MKRILFISMLFCSFQSANAQMGVITKNGAIVDSSVILHSVDSVLYINAIAISNHTAQIATKGRVDSIRLVTAGVLHNTPSTFSLSGNTGVVTETLANQSAYTLLGRGSGVGTPSFLPSIDSNYAPSLATVNALNNGLSLKQVSLVSGTNIQTLNGITLLVGTNRQVIVPSDTTFLDGQVLGHTTQLATITTQIAGKLPLPVTQIITTGSIVINNATNLFIYNSTGTTASATITLPVTPTDGQTVDIHFINPVTALTIAPSAGQTISQGFTITSVTAGEHLAYNWISSLSIWIGK